MGFGKKRIAWIKACLNSARASVLVNESPTKEFDIQRRLRQGDPMGPFLFIIAMEGLHVAFDNLVKNGLLCGAKIKQSKNNLNLASNALGVFYAISGLKINFQKSSIIGVSVSHDEVCHLASLIGCKSESLPFKYLGIPMGGTSKRISFWEPIITKFKKRLSSWKANPISIGGRTTLDKAVLGSLVIAGLGGASLESSESESLSSSVLFSG
uniref:uncharacterized protein LOC122587774 n=1 Tax=Erigeron canadensis TaxID=72917 RepID=UPI001CB917ED|nr:uncharacterized protein LOC122587774 [Erigeron canadensis]